MSNQSEKIRENSLKKLKILVLNCDSLSQLLPYLLPEIAYRVNCHDLEGVLHLPEVQRPPPSQKPLVLVKLIEPIEELRMDLSDLMLIIINKCTNDEVFNFVDDMVNILRALVMDPCPSVQLKACQVFDIKKECISSLYDNNRETLLHFTQPMARAILLPLVNPKSKIRIAALTAMTSVLYCGIWKHNAFIMEILIGFRDPNSVLLKEFFEYSTKLNYFAILINDKNASVREAFLLAIGDWVSRLPDKYDHHTRLVPQLKQFIKFYHKLLPFIILRYILTGLFDQYPEICNIAFQTIEECGIQLEKEKEKDFRDNKQLGVDAIWTMDGQLVDLPLPAPFKKRPNLGARVYIRSQIRHYLKALYKEISDSNQESRVKASQLLLMSSIYCEDYLTQFLYQMVPGLVVGTIPYSEDILDVQSAERIQQVFYFIGRFCDYKSYTEILFSGLKGDYKQNYSYINANLRALLHCLDGSMQATLKSGLGENKVEELSEVIEFISDVQFKENFGVLNIVDAEKLLVVILNSMQNRANMEEKNNLQLTYGKQILSLVLTVIYVNLENKVLLHKVLSFEKIQQILPYFQEFKLKSVEIVNLEKYEIKQLIALTFLEDSIDYYEEIREKLEINRFPDNIFVLLKISILNQCYKQGMKNIRIIGSICNWCSANEFKYYQEMFLNLSFFFENLGKVSDGDLEYLADIISYLIQNYRNFKLQDRQFLELVSRILDQVAIQKDSCESLRSRNKYSFQEIFDFVLLQIEEIKQPNLLLTKMCFQILDQLICLLPMNNARKYYGKFDEFYTNFIRYIIDESDIELRKYYFTAIMNMAKKAQQELIQLMEYSQRNKLFKRVEIIQACLRNSENN